VRAVSDREVLGVKGHRARTFGSCCEANLLRSINKCLMGNTICRSPLWKGWKMGVDFPIRLARSCAPMCVNNDPAHSLGAHCESPLGMDGCWQYRTQ
jgi:hypothetical protein